MCEVVFNMFVLYRSCCTFCRALTNFYKLMWRYMHVVCFYQLLFIDYWPNHQVTYEITMSLLTSYTTYKLFEVSIKWLLFALSQKFTISTCCNAVLCCMKLNIKHRTSIHYASSDLRIFFYKFMDNIVSWLVDV